jgi:hypothetical protein
MLKEHSKEYWKEGMLKGILGERHIRRAGL